MCGSGRAATASFYVTNDRKLTQAEVIAEANGRCNQENLIEQLKNGVRALADEHGHQIGRAHV